MRRSLEDTYAQAAAFAAAFEDVLPPQARRLAEEYAMIPKRGKLSRLREARRLGTLKCGGLRRAGQLWFL